LSEDERKKKKKERKKKEKKKDVDNPSILHRYLSPRVLFLLFFFFSFLRIGYL